MVNPCAGDVTEDFCYVFTSNCQVIHSFRLLAAVWVLPSKCGTVFTPWSLFVRVLPKAKTDADAMVEGCGYNGNQGWCGNWYEVSASKVVLRSAKAISDLFAAFRLALSCDSGLDKWRTLDSRCSRATIAQETSGVAGRCHGEL